MQTPAPHAVTVFHAPDIECAGCARAIQNALAKVAGVETVAVDIDHKTVSVTHDPQTTTAQTVMDALDGAGFPATVR